MCVRERVSVRWFLTDLRTKTFAREPLAVGLLCAAKLLTLSSTRAAISPPPQKTQEKLRWCTDDVPQQSLHTGQLNSLATEGTAKTSWATVAEPVARKKSTFVADKGSRRERLFPVTPKQGKKRLIATFYRASILFDGFSSRAFRTCNSIMIPVGCKTVVWTLR